MTTKLIKCGICLSWFSPLRGHCPICGAEKYFVCGYIDFSTGRKIARGIPIELDQIIDRVLARAK